MIRLLLVDDHEIIRQSLRAMFEREPDIEVVGEVSNGEEALLRVRELSPSLVLMDLSMRGLNGTETTLRMIRENPGLNVLALTSHTERRFVSHMLNAGALGYASKCNNCEELLIGIRTVAAGNRYLSPDIAQMLEDTPPDKWSQAKLGRREIDVLKLIARGNTSPEIARILHIATGTVEIHRSNIMQKLGLHNIAELTLYAIREDLLPL